MFGPTGAAVLLIARGQALFQQPLAVLRDVAQSPGVDFLESALGIFGAEQRSELQANLNDMPSGP